MRPICKKMFEARRRCWRIERELRYLLRRELRCKPLYVVLESELPPGTCSSDFLGCASPALAEALRPHIANRWQGDGAAIYIADRTLAKRAETSQEIAHVVNGVAAHEAAHVVAQIDRGVYSWPPPPSAFVEALSAELKKPLDTTCFPTGYESEDPPWDYHDEQFFRAALHLAYRLRMRGFFCAPSHVADTSIYELGVPAGHLSAALEEEYHACSDLTLLEILERALPVDYAAIWEREHSNFKASIPLRKEQFMLQFFDKLRVTAKREELTAAAAFKKLAIQIADGQEPKVEKVLETLRAAGKSVDDLNRVAELIIKRRRFYEKVRLVDDETERRQTFDVEFKKADEKLAAAEKEHEDVCGPLRYQLMMLDAQMIEAQQARRELELSATDPTLLSRLETIRRQIGENRMRSQERRTHIERVLKTQLTGAEVHLENLRQTFFTEEMLASRRADLDQVKGWIAKAEGEIQELKARLPDLERQEAELVAELLEPTAI